jgi:ABC-type transporter Mla subunit MlaD
VHKRKRDDDAGAERRKRQCDLSLQYASEREGTLHAALVTARQLRAADSAASAERCTDAGKQHEYRLEQLQAQFDEQSKRFTRAAEDAISLRATLKKERVERAAERAAEKTARKEQRTRHQLAVIRHNDALQTADERVERYRLLRATAHWDNVAAQEEKAAAEARLRRCHRVRRRLLVQVKQPYVVEIRALKTEVERLTPFEEQLSAATEQLSAATAEVERLTPLLRNATAKIERLEEQLSDFKAEVERLAPFQQQLSDAKAEVERLVPFEQQILELQARGILGQLLEILDPERKAAFDEQIGQLRRSTS